MNITGFIAYMAILIAGFYIAESVTGLKNVHWIMLAGWMLFSFASWVSDLSGDK